MSEKIYDISMPIHAAMPVYKGYEWKRPEITVVRDFDSGSVHETELKINLHTGTHIDAPLHILPDGGTVDEIGPAQLVRSCKVLDFTGLEEKITASDLEKKVIEDGDFILLKTRNSLEDILEGNFVYLEKSGAEYLKGKKTAGVGIDALGIERNQPEHETHKLLLGAGIIIIEGLRLAEVPEGIYQLIAAPLCIVGSEAAPVRALLMG